MIFSMIANHFAYLMVEDVVVSKAKLNKVWVSVKLFNLIPNWPGLSC